MARDKLWRGSMIWVISHCEVVLTAETYLVDEAVMFTASSKRAAEKLIRRVRVDPGTWWRLECARLDDVEGTVGRCILFSRDGRAIRTAPVKQGYRAAIARDKRLLVSLRKRLADVRRDGGSGSKKLIVNLQSTIGHVTKNLSGHVERSR